MNIAILENKLRAKYVGVYNSGHAGSRILRFRRGRHGIVAKCVSRDNAGAIADMEGNMRGYAAIRKLGGVNLLPSGLEAVTLKDEKILLMRDLGDSLRARNIGYGQATSLWLCVLSLVRKTKAKEQKKKEGIPFFVTEVLRHIDRFSCDETKNLTSVIRQSGWNDTWGADALMPLDFTPDNLFFYGGRLKFIDPWPQNTYLGNPAVSIGQFTTLVKLYRMKDARKVAYMLERACVDELPALLGASRSAVKRALRLGATLQFALSAYVRRETDPRRAAVLARRAYTLWC